MKIYKTKYEIQRDETRKLRNIYRVIQTALLMAMLVLSLFSFLSYSIRTESELKNLKDQNHKYKSSAPCRRSIKG